MAGAPWRERLGLVRALSVFEVALYVPGASGVSSQKTDLEVR